MRVEAGGHIGIAPLAEEIRRSLKCLVADAARVITSGDEMDRKARVGHFPILGIIAQLHNSEQVGKAVGSEAIAAERVFFVFGDICTVCAQPGQIAFLFREIPVVGAECKGIYEFGTVTVSPKQSYGLCKKEGYSLCGIVGRAAADYEGADAVVIFACECPHDHRAHTVAEKHPFESRIVRFHLVLHKLKVLHKCFGTP